MKINEILISKIEHLARLELSDAEREGIRNDLNSILQMVEKMNELNTDNVEPLIYINNQQNVWRDDKVQGQVSQKDALRNAPDKNEQFFKVPKII